MSSQTDFSDFFITRKQANDFIQSLSKITDQLFEVNFKLDNALTDEFGIDKKDKFLNLLRDLKMNTSSKEELKNFFLKLQDEVRKLPVITLTIAYEPNETSLKAFLEWFLFNLKKQILIDIQIDKKLIAGATLNYNGKYKDYSVKPLFDSLINQEINQKKPTNNHTVNKNVNVIN